jgi:hypothetical protein
MFQSCLLSLPAIADERNHANKKHIRNHYNWNSTNHANTSGTTTTPMPLEQLHVSATLSQTRILK